MYNYALDLLRSGKAFADDTVLGKGNDQRKSRKPSDRRDMSINDTLRYFSAMHSGSPDGQNWCLRARMDYASPNGALRDPVIYRCNNIPHNRTGTTWHIYPTYDFCAPVLDAVEGVTLACRTTEYRGRNAQYHWIQDALGLKRVPIYNFSRLNFVKTPLSKRQLSKIVEKGLVTGWDDPRMPAIRGLLRRGLTVDALRDFIGSQGASKNVLNLQWRALWALNKSKLDPVTPRYTAVADDAVSCTVTGLDAPYSDTRPTHAMVGKMAKHCLPAKNAALGDKVVHYAHTIRTDQDDVATFKDGEQITLMNWGNAYVRNIQMDAWSKVTSVRLDLNLTGNVKGTKKITWLATTPTNLVLVDLVSFDYLITKDKLDPKKDILEDLLAQDTEKRVRAFADCNVRDLQRGVVIQFDRKGYYRLDDIDAAGIMVIFQIPTK
jgi:glutamyl-tRNA synthetase